MEKTVQKKATRDAYGEALVEVGKKNPNVVVLDADLSKSTKTNDFKQVFPDRFINAGIAEANMVGMAAGLSSCGKVPFASTFALFGSLRVADMIRNSVCYPNLNVKIAVTHQGLTLGEDGASHQAVEDVALLRAMPNMTVIIPADATETKKAIHAAAETYGPMYIRMGRPSIPVLFDDSYDFQIGKGIQIREGNDVAIIATGVMVHIALEAAELLAGEGINARVINMATIKPIDEEIIVKAAQETKGIVTAEECNILGGLGAAVAEVLCEKHPAPLRRVGVEDTFGESGKPDELLQKYGLTAENIAAKAKELL